MFALLKFKERSVAAFSHAFVLTIKILLSLENIEQNTNSLKQFPFSDKSEVQTDEESVCVNTKKDKKENKCSTYSSRSDISKKHKEYNIQDQALEPKNKNTELGDNLIVSDLTGATANEESVKDKSNFENNSRVPKTSKISSNANNIQLSNSSSKLLEANKYTNKKDFTERKSVSNTNKLQKDNSVDSTNVDSINLPYQYLMEKEVEDAKQKISNNEIKNNIVMHNRDEQSSKRHKLEEIDEKYFSNPAAQDSPSPKRRKHSSDNLTARSSDITNLVMEGLMFTIRQGQDAVAVIEQKTKLEIDEVLENSEKIETTKGQKCLRNSSLLGLENLITMLELPKKTEAKRKCKNAVIQENMLEGQPTSKLLLPANNGIKQQNVESYLKYMQWEPNIISEAGASFTYNNENSKIYDEREYSKNTKIIENEDTECEEEEEEDIVPEALQDEIFQQSMSCFQKRDKLSDKLEVSMNKDLLMDDMDTEELTKSEALESKLNPFLDTNLLPKVHELSAESTTNEVHKYNTHCRTNVPIIVSNEIITADQIPLALQKILENKLSTVSRFETSGQETCQEKDTDFSLQLKDHAVHSNILQSTQYPGNSQTPMHSINRTLNESTLSVMPNVELENVSARDCNLELSREEPQKLNVNMNKKEQLLPNKLQDITHEFCQELLHLQRRENLIDQKCLRSRKSLKDVGDNEARLEMIKFFHDITRGAKVVIRRMSTKSIHNILKKSSSLATCIQH